MRKKIILTGGGSAGHVTPHLAIISSLKKENHDLYYIGSRDGIEKEIIKKTDVRYFSIATGRLRRYFTWKNFVDPLKILLGVMQAFFYIRKIRPNLIFSKGGFVSVPVVIAGWMNRIPVFVHESDYSPGLANKLSFPFAKKIFVTFAETERYIKQKDKIEKTGSPVRAEFFAGDPAKGREICGFDQHKKNILIMGGGLGSKKINDAVHQILPKLLSNFNVVHLCGINKTRKDFFTLAGYKQFEYLHQEVFDVMAAADLVISRAGSNSLYELLVLKKPHLLIPLSKKASRGEQVLNADYYQKKGLSYVLEEENLTAESLLQHIELLNKNLTLQKEKLENYNCADGTQNILKFLQ